MTRGFLRVMLALQITVTVAWVVGMVWVSTTGFGLYFVGDFLIGLLLLPYSWWRILGSPNSWTVAKARLPTLKHLLVKG